MTFGKRAALRPGGAAEPTRALGHGEDQTASQSGNRADPGGRREGSAGAVSLILFGRHWAPESRSLRRQCGPPVFTPVRWRPVLGATTQTMLAALHLTAVTPAPS